MKYFINGEEVSQTVYDRDAEDNFNAGVEFTETKKVVTEMHMEYQYICEACQ